MNIYALIKTIEADQQEIKIKKSIPKILIGDTVKIDVLLELADSSTDKKVDKKADKKSDKQRVQAYQGVVIAQHKAGINTTITVRRIFQGIGVERIFPLYSLCVQKIQVLRSARVSRAKLYYLRNRVGKGTRLKEKVGTS